MKRKVIAFYEDKRGEQIVNFGPHALALASVADRLGVQGRWALKAIEGNPKNGATKAIAAAAVLAETQPFVLLLLDEDRVRHQLNLPSNTPEVAVMTALGTLCPQVGIGLLLRNTEDLVQQAASALGVAAPSVKDRHQRDALLNRLADDHPQARQQLLDALPSWKHWVDLLETAARRAGYP